MKMKCIELGRLGAILGLPLLLSSCVTLFGPGPGPDRFAASTQQLEALLPPLERFRLTYIRDFASCGKDTDCVPGSRPNFAEPPTGTALELAFKHSYDMCLKLNGCLVLKGEAFEQGARKCQ